MNLVNYISNKFTFKPILRRAFGVYARVTACLGLLFLTSPLFRFGLDNAREHIKKFLQHIGGLLLLTPYMIYLYFISCAVVLCIFLFEVHKLRKKVKADGLKYVRRYALLLPFKICFYFMSLVGTFYLFLIVVSRYL